MRDILTIILSAVLLFASGLWQGKLSGRWQPTREAGIDDRALREFPASLADWDGTDFDVSTEQLKMAEADGYLSRRYVHRRTGNVITLLVLFGPPGPMSLHAPTVCFPGAGFLQETEPVRTVISNGNASCEFAMANFSKQEAAAPLRVRTYWSWFGAGGWQVPRSPRVTFARQSRIFKVYVTQATAGASRNNAEDACLTFLESALPALTQAVQGP